MYVRSLDQSFAQPALTPQPALGALHPSAVALVVVAKQVQQAMQREHFQLGLFAVARFARLTPGDAARNHDISEEVVNLCEGG